MIIAVVGCTHGELNLIYSSLTKIEKENNLKVDLLICCGDFQCIRTPSDNDSLNVPNKYKREINDFQDYYTGEKKAPVLTIFIGGNHEAMNVLKQLYYGGWVAPNIYFLGYSNVHNINNFRIASLSGIYKKYSFMKTYDECYPFNDTSKVSAYHIRKYEIEKLQLLEQNIDIMISHDWPNEIEKHGNVRKLLQKKKFFETEIQNNTLGNPYTKILLTKLKPQIWFAAHLHVKYAALYIHNEQQNQFTRFLALDKAQPLRNFLQILNIQKKEGIIHLTTTHLKMKQLTQQQNEQQIKENLTDGSTLEKKSEEEITCTTGPIQKDQKEKHEDELKKEKNKDELDSNEQNEDQQKEPTNQMIMTIQKTEEQNEASETKKQNIYICYDIEWLAILRANHHLISINNGQNYNTEILKYPSSEDFDFIENKLKNKVEEIDIENKKYYLVHGYKKPCYKNLYEQRRLFLNRFHFEELSIYDDYEDKYFAKEEIKLEEEKG